MPTALDQARDELFSHILRCGVLEAAPEHQKEWIDDTMQYIADRYTDLKEAELAQVRILGERFCQPVVRRVPSTKTAETATAAPAEESAEAPKEEETAGATA
jgi:hypothetical protein